MVTAIRTCRSAGLAAAALCQVSVAALVGGAGLACKGEGARASAVTDGVSAQVPVSRPSIDFDARVHDFGVVNEGPPVRHVFKIENKGSAPLVLSGASASCGCTSAILDANTIPPGGSASLTVVMDTRGEKGKGTRTITVYSDDPTQPEARLEIAYDVKRLLDFERSYLHLSSKRGLRRVETVWLVGELLMDARPRVATIQPERTLHARLVRSRAHGHPRQGLQIVLQDKDTRAGQGAVVLDTGLVNPRELTLPIRYTVD